MLDTTKNYMWQFSKRANRFDLTRTYDINQRDGICYMLAGRSDQNTLSAEFLVRTHLDNFFKQVFLDSPTSVNLAKELFDLSYGYDLRLKSAQKDIFALEARNNGTTLHLPGTMLENPLLVEQVNKRAHKLGIENFLEYSSENDFGDYIRLAFDCFSIPQKYILAAERGN